MDSLARSGRDAIAAGSKSFAIAARLFEPRTRESAYLLYAWCRHCDDLIDDQLLGHRRAARAAIPSESERQRAVLAYLYAQTRNAVSGGRVSEPVFMGLQRVVREHRVAPHLPIELLDGFAMDVGGCRYQSIDDTLRYCYHAAGVVGRMMARVMGAHDPDVLHRATDLGIAFQLCNIARDVIDDYRIGRIYLPGQWLDEAGVCAARLDQRSERAALARTVARLLKLSEDYYQSAAIGIGALRWRSAWAVASARRVYREIGMQIARRGVGAWDERVVVSRRRKLLHLIGALAQVGLIKVSAARSSLDTPRDGLWTHPLDAMEVRVSPPIR